MKTKFTHGIFLLSVFAVLNLKANFGGDVKVKPDATINEHNVDLAVAFNGWIYQSVLYDSAYSVLLSKDSGQTWTEIVNYNTSSTDDHYVSISITVAGMDTASLYLFVAGVRYTTSSNNSIIYVDKHDGRDGTFINENYHEGFTNPTRGNIDITTDYLHPSFSSAPFAVIMAYVRASPQDSIFYVVSYDGGVVYSTKTTVATTSAYFRHISVAYTYSSTWGGGRAYFAFDQFSSSVAPYGHIYAAHTDLGISGIFTPFNLDSLTGGVTNLAANPVVTASNTLADNDSGGVTVMVAFERNYNGTGDIDILEYHNLHAPSQDIWVVGSIDNSGSNTCFQPNASFDAGYNNFLVTYYDSTNHSLPYFVAFGLNFDGNTNFVVNNYADDQAHFVSPWPVVVINPVAKQAAMAWNTVENGNGIAWFDCEYSPIAIPTGVQNIAMGNLNSVSVYPNPANDQIVVNYVMEETADIRVNLYDLNGRLVRQLADETVVSGKHTVITDISQLPQALYQVVVESDSVRKTLKLAVTR